MMKIVIIEKSINKDIKIRIVSNLSVEILNRKISDSDCWAKASEQTEKEILDKYFKENVL